MGRNAGRKDDPPFLPSFPLEPSAAGAEPAGPQPGEFVAAAGAENLKDYTNRNAADLANDAADDDPKKIKEQVNANSKRAFKVID